jgi:hypothetical protein
MDLRSTIRAVSRLPFVSDQLVEILCDSEPGAAKDSTGEDHTTFWLVVADQFARRGIVSDRVRNKALEIINHGLDLSALQNSACLRQIWQAQEDARRTTCAAYCSPVSKRVSSQGTTAFLDGIETFLSIRRVLETASIRISSPEMYKFHHKDGSVSWQWQQDGWAAMIAIDEPRIRVSSWYRPLTLARATAEKPSLETCDRATLEAQQAGNLHEHSDQAYGIRKDRRAAN